jgi:hypothetical protein
MDLGRKSLRQLGHLLGTVLDAEISAAPADEVRDTFEISDSNERPGASAEKVLGAFMPFFEGGLCLRVEGHKTFLTSLFLFGQTFTPAEAHGTPVNFKLKSLELNRVYKMALAPLLKSLDLGTFFRLDEASAFAFAISRDTIFVLFDNRPHPWQVFAIENAFLSARDTFARLSAPKPAVMSGRGFFK